MRKLISLFVAGLLAVSLGACDQQLTRPDTQSSETQINADRGQASTVVASADLRAVKTLGARDHGFKVGEKVGTIEVTDDGTTIVVTDGEASGLDPGNSFGYLSLFYDKLSSVAGSPSSENSAINASACEPGADEEHPLHLTEGQMLAAIWAVDSDGNGTPFDLDGEYVAVDEIGTVSIRDLRINEGFGPDAVVACGVVTRDPAK